MADFHVYDVPGRASHALEAADFTAAKAKLEASLPVPANSRREWKLCGSGQLLTVKSARGAQLGSYLLRSA